MKRVRWATVLGVSVLLLWGAALPASGDECVVTGLRVGGEGRRADVHTSLYAPDGTLLAWARATWISV